MSFQTRTEIFGVPVTVEYSYESGSPGSREYPGGPPLEPDDPGEVTIEKVFCEEDVMELLGEATMQAIQEHAEGDVGEQLAADRAEYAEYLADCARDRAIEERMENNE